MHDGAVGQRCRVAEPAFVLGVRGYGGYSNTRRSLVCVRALISPGQRNTVGVRALNLILRNGNRFKRPVRIKGRKHARSVCGF